MSPILHWKWASRTILIIAVIVTTAVLFNTSSRKVLFFLGEPKSLVAVRKRTMNTEEEPHREVALYLPFPKTTLPARILLWQQWVSDLQKILSAVSPESPPVHIIAGNYKYREVMLNWLITAKIRVSPPLTNIIVVSIDSPLCQLLNKRDITCLYVHWKDYLTYNLGEPFRLILVLRLTVIRLLNYWGYDAANIDTDALILKNPESLYQEFIDSDMVAGHGTYPFSLGKEWGGTICGGTFMIRSTHNSEMYWRSVSKTNIIDDVSKNIRRKMFFDDQVKLNYALAAMDPVWEDVSTREKFPSSDKIKRGTTSSGFTVTLLSEDTICRKQCSAQLLSKYYVWHKLGKKRIESKTSNSEQIKLWFLRRDWENFNNTNATGEHWLKVISGL